MQKVKRNQCCLEPCLRQLVSCLEAVVVGNVCPFCPHMLPIPGSMSREVFVRSGCCEVGGKVPQGSSFRVFSEPGGHLLQRPLCAPEFRNAAFANLSEGLQRLRLLPGFQYSISTNLWSEVLWGR